MIDLFLSLLILLLQFKVLTKFCFVLGDSLRTTQVVLLGFHYSMCSVAFRDGGLS